MNPSQVARAIRSLTPEQRLQLRHLLNATGARRLDGAAIRESRFAGGIFCPHCSGRCVQRYGNFAGRQRYRCKSCKRTFNDFTGTPFHRTRYLEKWAGYLEFMAAGYSLRKCADTLAIHVNTAFAWRHKVLHAMAQHADEEKLGGIIEADETYELFSAKGSRRLNRMPRRRGGRASKPGISAEQACVVVARDRAKATLGKTTGLGRLASSSLERVLQARLAPGAVLCSDAGTAFRTFCREAGFWHRTVNLSSGSRVDGIYHLQNVNSVHKRFKDWSIRFNGVASKYLDNYWAWFTFLDRTKGTDMLVRANRLMLDAARGRMKADGETMPQFYDRQFMSLCA